MRAWQANMLGGVAAAGVLAAGLVVGAPATEANTPAGQVRLGVVNRPVEGGGEVPLGDGLEIWGQPVQLSLFWTPDETDTVTTSYLDAWESAGLVTSEKRMGNVSIVSALDESTGLMRSVTVLEHESGERLVLPGITDIRSMPDPTPTGAPVPVPDNAKAYMAHVADDVVALTYSGSFIVPMAPSRIVRFYEVELGKAGYVPSPRMSAGARSDVAEWTRGPESITVAASALEKQDAASSFVVVTHARTLLDQEAQR